MTKNKIDREKEKARIEALPFSLNAHIREIADFFKYAVANKNTSAVIIIDGRSGYGKTTLSNLIGTYCDTNGYGLPKVHFNPDTFLNGST